MNMTDIAYMRLKQRQTHYRKVCGKMSTKIAKDQNQQLDYKGENVAKCETEAAQFHVLALCTRTKPKNKHKETAV